LARVEDCAAVLEAESDLEVPLVDGRRGLPSCVGSPALDVLEYVLDCAHVVRARVELF